MKETRPSPDMLLEEAQKEQHGKLKIFLGAAPGVGKTFAMLNAAKSRRDEGIDTIIGIVETHKRHDTEALLLGLETIPPQKLDYRGLAFAEMDIDAILHRKPALVLVDELAHTNIPGARHPKRYQDVQEILEAGIDVYSTLNVQHIESLNDIVMRITGVTVRETVPDTVIQQAHAIELIDLPPDELLQRLKDGKVYIPEQARLAISRFFTPGNLTALRELALRQAAERVDVQMTSYMRRHSIEGPWPTSNRIMVCISDDRQAASLVRAARRSAERRQVPWLALYIETSRHHIISEDARKNIAQAIEMAETMGAEIMTVASEDVAGEILRIGRERNVSTIIIGKSVRSFWSRLTRPSVASAILDRGDGFDILLVNYSETRRDTDARIYQQNSVERFWDWGKYAKASSVVLIATLIAWPTASYIPGAFLSFFYVIAVLLVVTDLGLGFSAFATFLSGVALDILMNKPNLAFLPHKREDMLSLMFFLTTGFTISFIGDYLYRQLQVTRRNAERTQSLYDFTKSIAAAATIDDVAEATVKRAKNTLNNEVALLLPRHGHLEITAASTPELSLDTASAAAMDWAWRHGRPAGFRSETLPSAAFYGLPLLSGSNKLGVLAIDMRGTILSPDQNHFLTSVAYQAASAIERARLVMDVAQARLQTETEKLRASLLSSISHDLRLPLDNVIHISQQLYKEWEQFPLHEQREKVGQIANDADRLNRYIENLLDMTELVTGNITFASEELDVCGLLTPVVAQFNKRDGIFIELDCAAGMPKIKGDAAALRRVFVNVVENAVKYGADSPVRILARKDGRFIRIIIRDQGPGIPESERKRVFDMFYRVKSGQTGSVNGAGLGLSICRGLIQAHHGTIQAQAGEDGRGTSIIICLPIQTG